MSETTIDRLLKEKEEAGALSALNRIADTLGAAR